MPKRKPNNMSKEQWAKEKTQWYTGKDKKKKK
jgi:hypothetical protein